MSLCEHVIKRAIQRIPKSSMWGQGQMDYSVPVIDTHLQQNEQINGVILGPKVLKWSVTQHTSNTEVLLERSGWNKTPEPTAVREQTISRSQKGRETAVGDYKCGDLCLKTAKTGHTSTTAILAKAAKTCKVHLLAYFNCFSEARKDREQTNTKMFNLWE